MLMESELTQGTEKVKVGLEEKPSDEEAAQEMIEKEKEPIKGETIPLSSLIQVPPSGYRKVLIHVFQQEDAYHWQEWHPSHPR